jgi:hypothetical protein
MRFMAMARSVVDPAIEHPPLAPVGVDVAGHRQQRARRRGGEVGGLAIVGAHDGRELREKGP